MAVEIDRVREIAGREAGLAVVVTYRSDSTGHATVVNAGVLDHPLTDEPVVGIVVRGHARKLEHLRATPRATVVFRSGWEWVTVEGDVDLAGPDDPLTGISEEQLLELVRTIYAAAVGGSPADWAGLDEVMATERHAAVLVKPNRIYAGGPG